MKAQSIITIQYLQRQASPLFLVCPRLARWSLRAMFNVPSLGFNGIAVWP